MQAKQKPGRSLRFVLAVYVVSRLFYLVAGYLFARVVPVGPAHALSLDYPFGTMNLWAHFDGEHYARLASSGYLNPPDHVSPAFFPLYSLLMRSFAELFGGPISYEVLGLWGVLVSVLTLPFAFYFIYRIAEDGWGQNMARGAVLCLAFFPTAFFLNAAYTESLFLALSAGTMWAVMVRKNLLLACLLAGLATATRNVGIFLLVPLAYEWGRGIGYYRWWRGAYLLLAPAGLLGYMAYLWWRFGEPLLFYTEQQDWSRQATGPLTTLKNAWIKTVEGVRWLSEPGAHLGEFQPEQVMVYLNTPLNTYNFAFLIFAFVLVVGGLRVLPPGLWAYTLLVALFPALFGTPQVPLMGMPRYVLVAFPLFIVLGVLLQSRRALAAWLFTSATLSLVLSAMFVSWWFVA